MFNHNTRMSSPQSKPTLNPFRKLHFKNRIHIVAIVLNHHKLLNYKLTQLLGHAIDHVQKTCLWRGRQQSSNKFFINYTSFKELPIKFSSWLYRIGTDLLVDADLLPAFRPIWQVKPDGCWILHIKFPTTDCQLPNLSRFLTY